MINVITPLLCVSFPDRIVPNKPLTLTEAEALERIRLVRFRWYVTSWLNQGTTAEEAQEHLLSLAESHKFTHQVPSEALNPVELEALVIARDLIRRKLADRGIDLDAKQIEFHAGEIAKSEKIQERAQEIVKRRQINARRLLPKTAQSPPPNRE